MLKEKDRIVWRFKKDKKYVEEYIEEINGEMLLIADTYYEQRQ